MAEIAEGGGGGNGHHKGKKRAKKQSTRIDMTPMVDLAFLLLTFFVLTSTFSKAKVMSLVYPAKPEPNQEIPEQKIFNAITFIVTEDKLFYYEGQFYPANNTDGKPATQLEETNFGPNGVRKLLADGNRYVIEEKAKLDERVAKDKLPDSIYKKELIAMKKDDRALKVLIKTDTKATCKNFIDLIDELKIANIGVIAPVDMMQDEENLLKAKTQ